MEPTPIPPAAPAPSPVPTPMPPPPLPVPPAPVPSPATEPPKYAAGGFLKQFDWVEIGFMVLGAFALYHVVDYYRKKAKAERKTQATMAELEDKHVALETKLEAIGRRLKAPAQRF